MCVCVCVWRLWWQSLQSASWQSALWASASSAVLLWCHRPSSKQSNLFGGGQQGSRRGSLRVAADTACPAHPCSARKHLWPSPPFRGFDGPRLRAEQVGRRCEYLSTCDTVQAPLLGTSVVSHITHCHVNNRKSSLAWLAGWLAGLLACVRRFATVPTKFRALTVVACVARPR